MHFYCDCRTKKGKVDRRIANNGQGHMQKTCVDSTGVCTYCGYTAVALREENLHKAFFYASMPALNVVNQAELRRMDEQKVWLDSTTQKIKRMA